jgi:hypothetical protein
VLDRHESPNLDARALLFMNRGDGTFEPKPTTFSGLDSVGISGEAADLNNDGLLDLVVASDPDNSGVALSMARYESKVYWNTGLHGANENHWLRLRFSGVKDADLIGARVEVSAKSEIRNASDPLDSRQPQLQERWRARNPLRSRQANQSGREGHAPQRQDRLVRRREGGSVPRLEFQHPRINPCQSGDQAMKHFFIILSSLCLLPSLFGAERKPNIILFLADDLGYADIGANGCKDIPTPNIDSPAKNGVRFTDGYATHSVCSPSRACFPKSATSGRKRTR